MRELGRGKTISFTGLFIPVVYKPGFFLGCEVLVFNEVWRVREDEVTCALEKKSKHEAGAASEIVWGFFNNDCGWVDLANE